MSEAVGLGQFGAVAEAVQVAQQTARPDRGNLRGVADEDQFPTDVVEHCDEPGEVEAGNLGGLVDDHPLAGPERPVGGGGALRRPVLRVQPHGDVLGAHAGAVGLGGRVAQQLGGVLPDGEA